MEGWGLRMGLLVVTSDYALNCNGMTTIRKKIIDVYAPNIYLDKINNRIYKFIYLGDIDYDNYVRQYTDDLLVPTAERALVDYIRFEKIQDEGTLLWAMQDYLDSPNCDIDKLYEVSDFYNVPREEVDYWITEAKTEPYYSMG